MKVEDLTFTSADHVITEIRNMNVKGGSPFGRAAAWAFKLVSDCLLYTSTPETVNKALGNTKAEFSGVTGSFTMKKDHTPDKVITVVELKNGEQISATEVK